MSLSDDIAVRLKNLRKYYGFTQDQLAEATGVAKSSIGKYERGELRITVDYIEAFCKATGHKPEKLFVPALLLNKKAVLTTPE